MFKIFIAALFGLQMSLLAPTQASAQMLSTHEVVKTTGSVSTQILAELDKKSVQAELSDWGIDVNEVKQRVAGMSDSELQELIKGTQPHAGGDVLVISLTTVLLIVIIILLID